jgi:hypothetical protein
LIGAYVKSAQRLSGGDPTVVNAAVLDARRLAATTEVMARAPHDAPGALRALEASRSVLSAQEYETLSARLKGPAAEQEAQQFVFGPGATPQPAYGTVRQLQGGPHAAVVTPDQVAATATAKGVDPALANATADIESHHGANVGSAEHAAYRGNIYQLGPKEREAVGVTGGMGTAGDQLGYGIDFLAKTKTELAQALRREPTNSEVYLAHQQGVTGATLMLQLPNTRAGNIVGDAAVRGNGGDPNASARQFTQMWENRYNRVEAKYGGKQLAAGFSRGSSGQLLRNGREADVMLPGGRPAWTEPGVTAASMPEEQQLPPGISRDANGQILKNGRPPDAIIGGAPAWSGDAENVVAPLSEERSSGAPNVPPSSLPGDSNVPGLSSEIDRIFHSDLSPDAKVKASELARLRYSSAWSDQAHAYETRQRAQKQASEARESEIIADVYSPNPQITAAAISQDKSLTPEAQMRMIKFIEVGADPGVSPRRSAAETTRLLDDMRKPGDDRDHVGSMTPIIDAYTQGKLRREDFTFLQNQFTNYRNPDGEKLAATERSFVEGMKSSITKSNPLMGQLDREGDQKLYEFNWNIQQKIAQYRKAGKDPFDLFDPSKSDYLGSPEALKKYTTSLAESSQHIAQSLSGQTGVAVPIPPPAPAATQRKPGETLQDWVSRLHLGPPAHPEPSAPIARP